MDSSRIVPTPPAPDGQTQFSFDRFMLPLSARALFDNASVHAPPVIALLSPFETRSRTTRRWLSSRRSKPREIRSRARPTLPPPARGTRAMQRRVSLSLSLESAIPRNREPDNEIALPPLPRGSEVQAGPYPGTKPGPGGNYPS